MRYYNVERFRTLFHRANIIFAIVGRSCRHKFDGLAYLKIYHVMVNRILIYKDGAEILFLSFELCIRDMELSTSEIQLICTMQ